MERTRVQFKPSELLFLFAGAGILLALPWIDGDGFVLWNAAKVAYGVGIVFFIFRR